MFGDEVFNLKRLPLCASPLRVEKQNLSWVTGISVFPEKALGVSLSSFHLKIIC